MKRRIKILFTIPNFDTAGSGKVVYDLVKGLDKSRFEIEIACKNNKGFFFKTIESLGIPIHIYETKTPYRPYYSLLSRVFEISRFYKKHRYDIVHSWQWSNDWTEVLAAKMAGIKWLYTKKAMGFSNVHWKIKSFLADYIVTINDDMQDYFPYKKQQRLIPLGLDTDFYNSNSYEKKDTLSFDIITVANLVPVKGIEVLIKAVSLLKESSLTLTIIGDNKNDYGKTLEHLVYDLSLEQLVRFTGKKADVRPYIAAADLYVIPTLDAGRKEGMPMALVEAMSMGIPVLGSDITGINYVLKSFKDLLFPAGNAEALASKIRFVMTLDTVARRRLGYSLREYCKENFSMDSFISAHEELYIELLPHE